MRRRFRIFVLILALTAAVAGCDRKEERAAAPEPSGKKRETRVVIPEGVQGQWKAVRVTVTDKESGKKEVYTVDLGYDFAIPGSRIRVQAQNFLPAFIMEGAVMTSASNETKNPAVQVVIREDGKELFSGWLFSLYPGTHQFHHPRYSLTLVDFVPTTKKS